MLSELLMYITPAPILRRQIADATDRRNKLPDRESLQTLRGAYQGMITERMRALTFWPWRRERRNRG